ncbi:MAG: SUMF1/EgtB/PvdO family nonheme iron enzyme [Chloroflexi bacterium]|nr:SUMF1/EgtB/PvdO family nonheme iron enzyme [Chloroflexota bacterium]
MSNPTIPNTAQRALVRLQRLLIQPAAQVTALSIAGISLVQMVTLYQSNPTALAGIGAVLASLIGTLQGEVLGHFLTKLASPEAQQLTDAQIRTELETVLVQMGLPQALKSKTFRETMSALSQKQSKEHQQLAELVRVVGRTSLQAQVDVQAELQAMHRAVQQLSKPGVVVQGDFVRGDKVARDKYVAQIINIITNPPAPEPHVADKRTYLKVLRQWCHVLPLATLGQEGGANQEVGLDKVYTTLDTTARVKLTAAEKKQQQTSNDDRPLTADEAIRQHRCVVILGAPGSGKSSLVRQLAADAAALLAGPLPLLLTLRDLPPRLRKIPLSKAITEHEREQLRRAVFAQWQADIERHNGRTFADQLPALVADGHVLLIFDGLDEVPEESRRAVREAIQSVIHPQIERVIVTCRTRSYTGEAELPHFATYTLAPFSEAKIRQFVAAWYIAQGQLQQWEATQVRQRTADLQQSASNTLMRPLAENPLLLTTMAVVHQKKKELPKQRVLLYDEVVDVLVRRWQGEKTQGSQPLSANLRQLLYDESNQIMPLLQQLAYALHQSQAQQKEARLDRFVIFRLMEEMNYSAALIDEFLDYIDHRAGVLAGYGGGAGKPSAYDFLHRTFQEYLVGCYLIKGRNAQREYWKWAAQGDYWYVAAQLGAEALYYSNGMAEPLADLAYALCPEREPTTPTEWRAVVWSGYMATILGGSWLAQDKDDPIGGEAYLARLRRRLVTLIEETACPLNLFERAEAGRILGQLGDPREGVGVKDGLPDVAWGNTVPAGDYTIGGYQYGFKKTRPVTIVQDYQLAKYPVTTAQFQCFVEAKDFGDAAWWEGMPEEDRYGKVQAIAIPQWNYPNHPRETVSWYQAVAFARWLNSKLKDEGYEVRLPTEYEWEVAARYNNGRAYPWGDDFDPTKANIRESQLEQTTAVGLYPTGCQPTLDLYDVSGNVLEWCQNKYEYSTQDKVDDSINSRVLRGGSWFFNRDLARVASRYPLPPGALYNLVGFRLVRCVSSPISS